VPDALVGLLEIYEDPCFPKAKNKFFKKLEKQK
jgi:hypothetical protein